MKKTFYAITAVNIWEVIEDIELVGVQVLAMAQDSLTVSTEKGLDFVTKLMERRGFI